MDVKPELHGAANTAGLRKPVQHFRLRLCDFIFDFSSIFLSIDRPISQSVEIFKAA